jgi:hypothetical protein
MENSMEAPQKLKIELPYDSTISLLGICPKEFKSSYKKALANSCSLQEKLIKANLWKQQ